MNVFPEKPVNNLELNDLTSFLLELKSNGLNVYQLSANSFQIELNSTHHIKCSYKDSKCQVQLYQYENIVNFLDVISKIQLEEATTKFIKKILGNITATSLSARLTADEPATNYLSIANLVGSSKIVAVFDPYLENSSLATLITICSFGNGKIGENIRLLSSNKKAGGSNPTFTELGVTAFLFQTNVSGTARILSSNSEHRRFILLSGGKSLILGHSLNSIHKNEALRIEEDTEDKVFFDSMWNSATALT